MAGIERWVPHRHGELVLHIVAVIACVTPQAGGEARRTWIARKGGRAGLALAAVAGNLDVCGLVDGGEVADAGDLALYPHEQDGVYGGAGTCEGDCHARCSGEGVSWRRNEGVECAEQAESRGAEGGVEDVFGLEEPGRYEEPEESGEREAASEQDDDYYSEDAFGEAEFRIGVEG